MEENINNTWRDTIKNMAISHNLPVSELLAMAPNNDPFYIGSEAEIENAVWVYGIWKKMTTEQGLFSVWLRSMHYWYQSFPDSKRPNGEPYVNTDKDWKFLSQASRNARYFNLIPQDRIVDERNPKPLENINYYPDENFTDVLDNINVGEITTFISDKFSLIWPQNYQPYFLEIWCEEDIKGRKNVSSVLSRYHVNLIAGKGELSNTAVCDAINRIRASGKPARIGYISDFDPKGFQMPVSIARKFEWYSRNYDLDIKLKPIALTYNQCHEYELPRTPIKEGKGSGSGAKAYDTLRERFEDRFGQGATELDSLEAMNPGELANVIKNFVAPYYNLEISRKVNQHNRAVEEAVHNAVSEHEEKIRELIDSIDYTEAKEIAESWDTFPEDTELIDEEDEWLFSTDYKYNEQLKKYKEYHNTGGVN